jgi:uncharacterized integral membrane protein
VKVSTFLVVVPVVALATVVAVANRQAVEFSLDPISTEPTIAFSLPLYLLVFLTLLLGVVLGGVTVAWRRASRSRPSSFSAGVKNE